jgi:hypothetical protein
MVLMPQCSALFQGAQSSSFDKGKQSMDLLEKLRDFHRQGEINSLQRFVVTLNKEDEQ